MVKILHILTALVIVFLTSLPCFVVLRLYPILLGFNMEECEAETGIFLLMIFFGTLAAVLLNYFIVGSFLAALIGLTLECASIIVALILAHNGNRTIVYFFVLSLGFTIGFLQTIITAFCGDQYDNDLWYSEVNHYSLYLLGNITAYLISIMITPLVYTTGFYGSCKPISTNCYIMPLIVAGICLAVAAAIMILMYSNWDFKWRAEQSKLITIYRMEQAFYIFIPLIFLWMFTFLIQKSWINQAKNMSTKMQDGYLEMIHAVIEIMCIPIAWFIRIRNELLRITLGGSLIIASVPVSGLFGSFYAPVILNMSKRYNLSEVYFCSTAVGIIEEQHSYYKISNVSINVPAHLCIGPLFIDQKIFPNTTQFIYIPASYARYNTNYIYPYESSEQQVAVATIYQSHVWFYFRRPAKGFMPASLDRNFRSIAKLALVRFISFSESTKAVLNANSKLLITGTESNSEIQIKVETNYSYIMELPEGLYKVLTLSIAPLQIGRLNSSNTIYFRNGGYYNVFLSAPRYMNDNTSDQVEMSCFTRMPSYVCSIHFQIIQYILLSLGKLLILSSGLEISYALAEKDEKCSLIGVFWGVYNFANFIFYLLYHVLMSSFLDSISAIYTIMMAAIVTFYCVYYLSAYKLTDIILTNDK